MLNSHMHLHFVGIGGIGMSALAQLAKALGFEISGSDRDENKSENRHIFAPLREQGIFIYPQDGSFAKFHRADAIIYSSAIEADNPDFAAGKDIPKIHRAAALAELISLNTDKISIAVSGSCGKTSVSSFLAEALCGMGENPSCVNGGLIKSFRSEKYCGNFRDGEKFLVFEADESDKSLLSYTVDYAIILNLGHDHYPQDELIELFGQFLTKVKKAVVIEDKVFDLLREHIPARLKVVRFAGTLNPQENAGEYCVKKYFVNPQGNHAVFNDGTQVALPQPGFHTALNILAVKAMIELLGYTDKERIKRGLNQVSGAWRRFDLAGTRNHGKCKVFDDYAHNPEKIICCIQAAQELVHDGRLLVVFQPHGFKPLGFMRDELLNLLKSTLRKQDVFYMLRPFYAGGTSSFKPSSEEVIDSYRQAGLTQAYFRASRDQIETELLAKEYDLILIMGARDNSLSDWARALCEDKA